MKHELKTWPAEFQAVWDGKKMFEVRPNDRNYKVQNTLLLREWVPCPGCLGAGTKVGRNGKNRGTCPVCKGQKTLKGYTGREITAAAAFILYGPKMGIAEGFCAMSLGSVEKAAKQESIMDPITLPLIDAYEEEGPPARTLKGLTCTEQKHKSYKWDEYHFPEFGPARYYYGGARDIVLPLGGRRYKIVIDTDYSSGIPKGKSITFIPTEEPETPYSAEKLRAARVIAFGQPRFIQSAVKPSLNGRCACHLVTLETGWGDAGNENYLCALDENGVPAKVWMEASCC
jgi:hypothetical protein